jgi:hypothetical protein
VAQRLVLAGLAAAAQAMLTELEPQEQQTLAVAVVVVVLAPAILFMAAEPVVPALSS